MWNRLLLAAAVLTISATHNPQSGPLKPCTLPGINEQLLCGKLSVFENRRTRTGRKIDLNVIVLPALDQQHKEAPLFDLAGGPGIASTSAAFDYTTALRDYRRHRDVVLVDQRGTGESNPLHCKNNDPHYLREMYSTRYVDDCAARWSRSPISRNTRRRLRWMISTTCVPGSAMIASIS